MAPAAENKVNIRKRNQYFIPKFITVLISDEAVNIHNSFFLMAINCIIAANFKGFQNKLIAFEVHNN